MEINTLSWNQMIEKIPLARDWSRDDLPIQIVETHISVVFIGQLHVLKVKKPVNLGFLDYTTLEKRLRACEAEVGLNRRLCADTYLGVKTISRKADSVSLSPEGSVLDYGVWMRRLPSEGMLDHIVANGSVRKSIIESVSAKLSDFHSSAERGEGISNFGSIETISRNWKENFEQTAKYAGRTIDGPALFDIQSWVESTLAERKALFQERIDSGRIRDGHGDVRCESVCVTDQGICIFDCIEFNDRFRYADVASEAAFLAMDLDIRGRPDLGYYFAECYQQDSGDIQLFDLLPFYKCYRAFVRGKVLSFRLDDRALSDAQKQSATIRARVYFDYAHRYAQGLTKPNLIMVSGLSGTGKTSLARAIASEFSVKVISADHVRKLIFGQDIAGEYGKDAYGPEANRRTYEAMLSSAGQILAAGNSVIVDATFRRCSDRLACRRLAESCGASFLTVVCELDFNTVRQRLEERKEAGESLSDATWEIYLKQRDEFDPLNDAERLQAVTIDTERPIAISARTACDWIRARSTQQV